MIWLIGEKCEMKQPTTTCNNSILVNFPLIKIICYTYKILLILCVFVKNIVMTIESAGIGSYALMSISVSLL